MDKKSSQRWYLPWWWNVPLVALGVAGILLAYLNPEQLGYGMERFCDRVRPEDWGRLLGIYLVAMAITHFVVFFSNRALGCLLQLKEVKRDKVPNLLSPAFVGLCESIMYPTALVMMKGEFIAAWLALKVVGQWVRWGGESAAEGTPANDDRHDGDEATASANQGRRRFNRFLVGNALQVVAGVLTYGVLKVLALR